MSTSPSSGSPRKRILKRAINHEGKKYRLFYKCSVYMRNNLKYRGLTMNNNFQDLISHLPCLAQEIEENKKRITTTPKGAYHYTPSKEYLEHVNRLKNKLKK